MKTIPINSIKLNDGAHGLPKNPRLIKDERFSALCKSIRDNPEYMPARPIIINEDGVILGGNMRWRACVANGMTELPCDWVMEVRGWPLEKQRRFILLDNRGFGEDVAELILSQFENDELLAAGFSESDIKDLVNDGVKSETEKLSDAAYRDVYYEPKDAPKVTLDDCIDETLFKAKVKALQDSGLPKETQRQLKKFCYRFLKIDFEQVANYYFFNATEEEKEVMERLRLVLCDNGIQGFIDDGLLRIVEAGQQGASKNE